MSDLSSNPLSGIEKYEGSFEQDELGVTQIPTETIRLLNDFTLLALFTFLASCSSNWKLNAKHLASHFNCNKDKIYKAIDGLMEIGLLTRTIIRCKGKFVRYHYRIHLRQIVHREPRLEKPDTVKPDTVFPDTYKTDILPLENKECITTTNCESSSSFVFSETTDKNLLNQKLPEDPRSDREFLHACLTHVEHHSDKAFPFLQRAGALVKLLKRLKSEKILFNAEKPKELSKKESQEEKMKRLWKESEDDRRKMLPDDYNEDGSRKKRYEK